MSLPNVAPAEMEILRHVLDHHPITVREVAEHVARTKGHRRTTVLNVMERLRKKGYLTRELDEGLYRYSPSTPKAQMQRDLVRGFVDQVLGGSVEPFMAYLTQEARVDDAELAGLRELVERLDARDIPARESSPHREPDAPEGGAA